MTEQREINSVINKLSVYFQWSLTRQQFLFGGPQTRGISKGVSNALDRNTRLFKIQSVLLRKRSEIFKQDIYCSVLYYVSLLLSLFGILLLEKQTYRSSALVYALGQIKCKKHETLRRRQNFSIVFNSQSCQINLFFKVTIDRIAMKTKWSATLDIVGNFSCVSLAETYYVNHDS